MTAKKQIEEMAREISDFNRQKCQDIPFSGFLKMNQYGLCDADMPTCLSCRIARGLFSAGYRKQRGNLVSLETVKTWLYELAINNVGCVLDGDFSNACTEIISRLDGLQRFAEELKEMETDEV